MFDIINFGMSPFPSLIPNVKIKYIMFCTAVKLWSLPSEEEQGVEGNMWT
jgi:hypothetical protein